jgi:hypothetical protein
MTGMPDILPEASAKAAECLSATERLALGALDALAVTFVKPGELKIA